MKERQRHLEKTRIRGKLNLSGPPVPHLEVKNNSAQLPAYREPRTMSSDGNLRNHSFIHQIKLPCWSLYSAPRHWHVGEKLGVISLMRPSKVCSYRLEKSPNLEAPDF